jgi:hypothetical protein
MSQLSKAFWEAVTLAGLLLLILLISVCHLNNWCRRNDSDTAEPKARAPEDVRAKGKNDGKKETPKVPDTPAPTTPAPTTPAPTSQPTTATSPAPTLTPTTTASQSSTPSGNKYHEPEYGYRKRTREELVDDPSYSPTEKRTVVSFPVSNNGTAVVNLPQGVKGAEVNVTRRGPETDWDAVISGLPRQRPQRSANPDTVLRVDVSEHLDDLERDFQEYQRKKQKLSDGSPTVPTRPPGGNRSPPPPGGAGGTGDTKGGGGGFNAPPDGSGSNGENPGTSGGRSGGDSGGGQQTQYRGTNNKQLSDGVTVFSPFPGTDPLEYIKDYRLATNLPPSTTMLPAEEEQKTSRLEAPLSPARATVKVEVPTSAPKPNVSVCPQGGGLADVNTGV